MKLLVIGLEGIGLEEILADESLENLRRVAEFGCHAIFDSPREIEIDQAWLHLAAGSSLSTCEQGQYIWEQLGSRGKRSVLINTPPYRGQVVAVAEQVEDLDYLPQAIDTTSSGDEETTWEKALFTAIASALSLQAWNYLHAVDDRLTRLTQQAATQSARRDALLRLDRQFEELLELLDDETALTIVALPDSKEGNGFVLASANNPLRGEIEGAKAEDLLPTMLSLAGYDMPSDLPGKSLVAEALLEHEQAGLSEYEEALLRERLSGLGYF